jgi:hypothetical protein
VEIPQGGAEGILLEAWDPLAPANTPWSLTSIKTTLGFGKGGAGMLSMEVSLKLAEPR